MNIQENKSKPERFEIKYLRDIDKGHSMSKMIAIGSLIFSFCLIIVTMVLYKNAVIAQKPHPYILDKNGEIRKIYDSYDDGYETVSKKGCIEKAHELFFELNPDEQLIKSKISKSLYFGDFKGLYEYYNSQNYYNNIVQRNAVQYIKKDSIILRGDMGRFYGKMKIIGQGKVYQEKMLVTEFSLRTTDRTDNNLYGFYIENFKIIDNVDIAGANNSATANINDQLLHPSSN